MMTVIERAAAAEGLASQIIETIGGAMPSADPNDLYSVGAMASVAVALSLASARGLAPDQALDLVTCLAESIAEDLAAS